MTGRALLLAVALVLVLAMPAEAAITQAQLDSPGFLTSAWANFITSQNAALNAVLTGGTYIQWARNLMLGAFVITFIASLGKYAVAAAGMADLATVLVRGAIVTALFTTYTTWSGLCFQGAFELGLQIQQQALGSNDILAPALFIAKVYSAFQMADGAVFDFSVFKLVLNLACAVMFIIVSIAAFFAAAWPVLVFGVAKLTGPFMFPFLFHERTSSFFDGWLRFYAGALGFMVLGRICLIIVSLLFSSVFSVSFLPNPSLAPVVLQASDTAGALVLVAVAALSVLLLFATGGFVAVVVGGANLGLAQPLGRLARTVAAFR